MYASIDWGSISGPECLTCYHHVIEEQETFFCTFLRFSIFYNFIFRLFLMFIEDKNGVNQFLFGMRRVFSLLILCGGLWTPIRLIEWLAVGRRFTGQGVIPARQA